MARYNHDPSSSLEKGLSRRGMLAGILGGAVAMGLAGCSEKNPATTTQSSSPPESPSASPSPTETIDPKDLAEKRYKQIRKSMQI